MARPVQRGEVYRLIAAPSDSDEAAAKQRPVVVVSRDDLNRGHSVIVVPFYSQQLDKRRALPFCVEFRAGEAGLDRDCVAKCDQITTLDKQELDLMRGSIGRVTAQQMSAIVDAVRYCLRDHTLPSKSP